MSLTDLLLVPGEFYRCRNGIKVGPLEPIANGGVYVWQARTELGLTYTYTTDGQYRVGPDESGFDLVRCCRALGRVTPIDRMSLDQYRRGVARVMGWDREAQVDAALADDHGVTVEPWDAEHRLTGREMGVGAAA